MPDEDPTPPVAAPPAPPVTPPPAAPPAQPPAQPSAAPPANPEPPADPHPNDPHKYRRLFEREETTRKEAEKTAAAEKERADTAETERLAALRRAVAAENGLAAEAVEFLTGTDEETLLAQATKLGGMVGAKPVVAGSVTNPGGNQQPSVDEQIAAAQKAGNTILAITLKRQQAGIGRQAA